MTIAQLAEETGLSNGFISLLERNEVAASVATLIRLCDALDVSIGSLFEQRDGAGLVRREDRPPANFGGYGVRDTLLTWAGQRQLEVIESRVDPSGHSGEGMHSFEADSEMIYVIAGALDVEIEEQFFHLRREDALTLNPRAPHRWQNPSRTREADILWIITPAGL